MKRLALVALAGAAFGLPAPSPAQDRQVGGVDQHRTDDAERDRHRTNERRSHYRGNYPQGVTKVGEPNSYEPKVGAPNPYATQGGAPNPYATQGGTPNPYATQGGTPANSGAVTPRR